MSSIDGWNKSKPNTQLRLADHKLAHHKNLVTVIKTILFGHWLRAYRTNALYSGHIFVRFNDLEDVFT